MNKEIQEKVNNSEKELKNRILKMSEEEKREMKQAIRDLVMKVTHSSEKESPSK